MHSLELRLLLWFYQIKTATGREERDQTVRTKYGRSKEFLVNRGEIHVDKLSYI